MSEFGVATVGLPLGCGAHDDGDRSTIDVHIESPGPLNLDLQSCTPCEGSPPRVEALMATDDDVPLVVSSSRRPQPRGRHFHWREYRTPAGSDRRQLRRLQGRTPNAQCACRGMQSVLVVADRRFAMRPAGRAARPTRRAARKTAASQEEGDEQHRAVLGAAGTPRGRLPPSTGRNTWQLSTHTAARATDVGGDLGSSPCEMRSFGQVAIESSLSPPGRAPMSTGRASMAAAIQEQLPAAASRSRSRPAPMPRGTYPATPRVSEDVPSRE